ncbi:MAG: protease family protein [Actinomycetota bacterium]|nr:protease family protein [Actinomycetota bacterium]
MTSTAALVIAVAVLTVHNLGVERLRPAFYVPACGVTATTMVGLATWAEIDVGDLGLSATGLRSGLVAGAVALGVVVIAGLVPATRLLFADRRMIGVGPVGTVYRAAVRIPFGTVLVEEVAFRGVLLALVGGPAGTAWAVVVSSALFGLWHVVPLRATLGTNAIAPSPTLVGGTVVALALVGAGLCWLRLVAGGLAAPAVVHASASAGATVVAFFVVRRPSTLGAEFSD